MKFFKPVTTDTVMALFTEVAAELNKVAEIHLAKSERLNKVANEARASALSAANEAAKADAMFVRISKLLGA